MKTLVLVLATAAHPYPDLIRAQKRTWAARDLEGVDVLFYYGAPAFAVHGRDVYVEASDDFWSIGHKTIAVLEYVLANREFDVIFRTNCSSYVDLPNLRDYVRERARPELFYAGANGAGLGEAGRDDVLSARLAATGRLDELKRTPDLGDGGTSAEWSFASGSGYFLTRDLVEWVVAHGSLWDHALPDDMALGRMLGAHGVAPEPAPRLMVTSLSEPRRIDTSHFHFRCRTDSSWRRGDIDVMLRIDATFAAERGEAHVPWFTQRRRVKSALRKLEAGLRARTRGIQPPGDEERSTT